MNKVQWAKYLNMKIYLKINEREKYKNSKHTQMEGEGEVV